MEKMGVFKKTQWIFVTDWLFALSFCVLVGHDCISQGIEGQGQGEGHGLG